jgi:hypothetical protein
MLFSLPIANPPPVQNASVADRIAHLHQSPASRTDAVLARLEGRLAELALVEAPETVARFETRLANIVDETAEDRRALLLDSLEMDLGAGLAGARKRSAAAQELRLTLAELGSIDATATHVLADRADVPGAPLAALLAEARKALTERRKLQGAQARRAAVLVSLAGLGYEVGESLSTAWVEQGRIVLRKAAQPDYGVEISGDPAFAKMQMRVVAFTDSGTAPNLARDKDAETLWCGDVAALQAQLAKAGGGLVIERALAVGATPLKRIAAPAGVASRTARDGPAQQSRTLRGPVA